MRKLLDFLFPVSMDAPIGTPDWAIQEAVMLWIDKKYPGLDARLWLRMKEKNQRVNTILRRGSLSKL